MNTEMIDRIATRIEEAYDAEKTESAKIEAGRAMYYLYFRVSIYRNRYQTGVNEILALDGYEACIMTLAEIEAYEA